MRPRERPSEAERLAELHSYGILDTPPDPVFEGLVELVAQICEVPIALVSLVDRDRQWFKSAVGLGVQETPREHAFCAQAILAPDQLLVVTDAVSDPRFAENPLVTSDPKIRFYAGAPLVTADGYALGTLCAIDRRPRSLNSWQLRAMRTLSQQVSHLLDLHRRRAQIELNERFLDTVMDTLAEGVVVSDAEQRLVAINASALRILHLTDKDAVVGGPLLALYRRAYDAMGRRIPPTSMPGAKTMATGTEQRGVIERLELHDQSNVWLEVNTSIVKESPEQFRLVTSFREVSAPAIL